MKALAHAVVVGLVVGTVIVAGVSVAASIHYMQVTRSFLFVGYHIPDGPILCQYEITPMAGTEVTLHWWATNWTSLSVVHCAGDRSWTGVYGASGTNGSDSFVAQGGRYMFGGPCIAWCQPPATVAGNYSVSVLVL